MTERLARIEHLIGSMIDILDRVEVSDEGNTFRTTIINDDVGSFGSVRVHEVMKLSETISQMKEWLADK